MRAVVLIFLARVVLYVFHQGWLCSHDFCLRTVRNGLEEDSSWQRCRLGRRGVTTDYRSRRVGRRRRCLSGSSTLSVWQTKSRDNLLPAQVYFQLVLNEIEDPHLDVFVDLFLDAWDDQISLHLRHVSPQCQVRNFSLENVHLILWARWNRNHVRDHVSQPFVNSRRETFFHLLQHGVQGSVKDTIKYSLQVCLQTLVYKSFSKLF